ncbi:MAG: trehalose-6-phosphate synthase, partial [Rhodomicrobium sp.]|nr:trehalose-6-phosphate synthase [Rhodomicrobium sp.]
MRLALKYGIAALVIAVLLVTAIAPVATSLVQDWSRRDVELRSALVFNSIRDGLPGLLEAENPRALKNVLERVALDERILALGICLNEGTPKYTSKLMPVTFSCEKVARSDSASFSTLLVDGHSLLAGSFPISLRQGKGHFVILNDMSFGEKRVLKARFYLSVVLGGIVLASALLAALAAVFLIRRWAAGLRQSLAGLKNGGALELDPGNHGPLANELRDILRQLDQSRVAIDTAWTAEKLREVVSIELPGTEVIVVSNREPYIHNRGSNGVELQIPASGLVSALEPVMRACRGTWIAHGSGSADKDTVDADDRILVPPDAPSYTLRRVWLSEEEQEGYYYGFSNEGLWPLCHIAFTRPAFRESDWQAYREVNERFADAVVREARGEEPVVLIQDYHFALLPRLVREKLPRATIIAFWHIPWPNAETFGICPWKEEIIQGMLGSSILGFHTQFHCNNFIETVDRFAESRIDREHGSVTLGGNETFVRPYPISIEWPPAAIEKQQAAAECRAAVLRRFGLAPGTRLGVGVERFDYTKGVIDRLHAIDCFLTRHPEWRKRFVFIQAAAPTRSKLPAYQNLQEEELALTEAINNRHGCATHRPIELVIRHHEPDEVYELLRAADLCLVSSLHDGMNLVAKEFVAAREDEEGVLILSSFTGASRELPEALIVNPYDTGEMACAIEQALTMPAGEQRERMRLMRELVRSRNVYRWAGTMLLDASRIRKKRRILELAAYGHERLIQRHGVPGFTE